MLGRCTDRRKRSLSVEFLCNIKRVFSPILDGEDTLLGYHISCKDT